jgi:putative Ca2+/H+ antiporter (TMEM165/GDT1 family)
MIGFSWQLADSFILASSYAVGIRMTGVSETIPNTLDGDAFSAVFMEEEGTNVTFRIRAMSANNGTSPAIEVSWVVGMPLGELVYVVTGYLTKKHVSLCADLVPRSLSFIDGVYFIEGVNRV